MKKQDVQSILILLLAIIAIGCAAAAFDSCRFTGFTVGDDGRYR
jgi:hypothetical protein